MTSKTSNEDSKRRPANHNTENMRELTNGNAEPPETDLDYYARPENYGGSNLQSMQRFIIARDKQQRSQKKSNKKTKRRKEEDELFRRYRHILAFDDSLNPFSSTDDESEDEKSSEDSGVAVNGGDSSAERLSKPLTRHPTVSLTVNEAQRPLSDGRRISDSNNPLSPSRRPASATDDAFITKETSENATGKFQTHLSQQISVDPTSVSGTTLNSDVNSTSSVVTLVSSAETTVGGSGARDDTAGGTDNSLSPINSRKTWPRVKNRFASMSAETKSNQIRRKFSQAIKAVMSIRKLAAIMIKKSEEPSAMLQTFTDVIDTPDDFSENLKNQGLSFDPSYFKANKEISISSEVKNILNLPPASRSQEQIQTAMYGLQSLPSFAEYPLHMQEKLAKVAWYDKVPPKRTIIRQGHYAENFYFILSGQAVVTIMMHDPKSKESVPRTANFMRKGTSFGELALLHHSRRTATVTSQDTVQLLSIGREDFFDIFMSRQGTDEVPEHIKFISQLDFMKGWPIERLLEHPEHCLLHFFKRNMVIVKDSKQSEWLYIVKSGSCQILKQLRGVTAKLGIRKHEATVDERFHLPHTGTSVRGPKVDTGLFRPRPKSHRSFADSSASSEETCTSQSRSNPGRRGSGRARKLSPIGASGAHYGGSSPQSTGPKNSKKFSKENYTGMPVTGKAHFASTPRQPQGTSRLNGSLRKQTSSETSTPRSISTPPPVFVQVSRLKPRDVFGLELICFHDGLDNTQTSVSLVSRGAECIMLSKDFFRKHANEMVKKNLQQLVRPFPDEVTFQESLQRKADWDLYKHTLIEDITSLPIT